MERQDEPARAYPKSIGLSSEQAASALRKCGRNKVRLPETKKFNLLLRASFLWQPMPVMLWTAAVVELALGKYLDAGILAVVNLTNAILRVYEIVQATDAAAALKATVKPTAICLRDGRWESQLDAALLVPGDLIQLAAGCAIPADCMIHDRSIEVDESAMTGESMPVTVRECELAHMGATVARGETTATVIFTGKDTFLGRTEQLLGEAERPRQRVHVTMVRVLCGLAFVLVGTAFGYLLATGEHFGSSLSFAAMVLVAALPMGIEVVTTSTLAIGSRAMSRSGAVVTHLSAIEDLAGITMLCCDKTGILTKNKMVIQDRAATLEPNLTLMDLLKQGALATKWETPPQDALDSMILRCQLWYPDSMPDYLSSRPHMTQEEKDSWCNDQVFHHLSVAMSDFERLKFQPFDPLTKRTESTVRIKSTGAILKVTKGAPHVVQVLDRDVQKKARMMSMVADAARDGLQTIAVAVSEPIASASDETVTWHLTGLLAFSDPPRDDTKATIVQAQAYGVPIRMITGDSLPVVKKTCQDLLLGNLNGPNWPDIRIPEQLDANANIPVSLLQLCRSADAFAHVYPEHKFLIVESYRQLGYKCGLTGDSDAPAMKLADVSLAAADATDAAKAVADVLLTQEGLSTVIRNILIARVVFARMKAYLTYRVATTLQNLFFFFISVFALSPANFVVPFVTPNPEQWPRYFSLPVVFLLIITFINDGALISIGLDHALPSRAPESWRIPLLFLIASVLGAVVCLSALLLLYNCLSSWEPGSLFQLLGIGGLTYGQAVNVMFLQLAVSGLLTVFSARTTKHSFFHCKPLRLLCCTCGALLLTTALSLTWPCGNLDVVPVCGLAYQHGLRLALWVWLYCLVTFMVQDLAKVAAWRLIDLIPALRVMQQAQDPL